MVPLSISSVFVPAAWWRDGENTQFESFPHSLQSTTEVFGNLLD